jgi:glycerol uptake facilitator protein
VSQQTRFAPTDLPSRDGHGERRYVVGERTVVRGRRPHKMSRIEQFRARTGGEAMAEFFGTFLLIVLGCGAVAVAVVGLAASGRRTGDFGSADWLIINLGFGLAVTFAVYVSGGVSGAHLNPAVTLAFAMRRDFPLRKVPVYALAQTLGALCGAAIVFLLYDSAIDAFAAANKLDPRGPDTFGIFATAPAEHFNGGLVGPLFDQIVGTAVLLILVAALVDQQNQAPEANMSALLVGFSVVVIGLALGTNAGYAINPARDLGPRIFAWLAGWGDAAFPGPGGYWWVPIVGPLIGGPLGILLYDVFVGKVLADRPEEPEDQPGQAGEVPDAPHTDSR